MNMSEHRFLRCVFSADYLNPVALDINGAEGFLLFRTRSTLNVYFKQRKSIGGYVSSTAIIRREGQDGRFNKR